MVMSLVPCGLALLTCVFGRRGPASVCPTCHLSGLIAFNAAPVCGGWFGWLSVIHRWRPYGAECTGYLPTSEVKRRRARLVLGWWTGWEDLRVLPAQLTQQGQHQGRRRGRGRGKGKGEGEEEEEEAEAEAWPLPLASSSSSCFKDQKSCNHGICL